MCGSLSRKYPQWAHLYRKSASGCLGQGGDGDLGLRAKGYGVSHGGDGSILKLIGVMAAQL